jgi:hypothetical protein
MLNARKIIENSNILLLVKTNPGLRISGILITLFIPIPRSKAIKILFR